jgi:hypothetical protein
MNMIHGDSTDCRGLAALPLLRKRAAAAAIVLGALLLAACAHTPPRPLGDSVAVELGPIVRLLDVRTSSDQLATLIDDVGDAHVIIASHADSTLRHLVVQQTGAISLNEAIRQDLKVLTVDAAFDGAGRLHVLADLQHFVREPSSQWSEAATPWATAGLDTFLPRFVAGGTRDRPLLYAFDVKGKAVGAPARWDWYGVGGGFGAGIIWPWRTRGSRLAVAAEDGGRYEDWWVVDLDDNEDVADWSAIADPDGGVHVVYDAQRNVLAAQSLARYAHIESAVADDASPFRDIAGHRVRSVPGTAVTLAPEAPVIGMASALGFNAATRELLLVRQHHGGRVLRDGMWGPEVPFPMSLAWEPRVLPSAAGAFDVVVTGSKADSPSGYQQPVFYLRFRDGRWSAPVEIADAASASFFGSVWGAVRIANDGKERVFVTWPVPDGIDARWLRVPVK